MFAGGVFVFVVILIGGFLNLCLMIAVFMICSRAGTTCDFLEELGRRINRTNQLLEYLADQSFRKSGASAEDIQRAHAIMNKP